MTYVTKWMGTVGRLPTFLLATVLAATACQAPPGSSGADAALAVDALLEPFDISDGPGGVVGVYLDGEIVFARGFGLANLEYEIPNTASTVFRVGSVAKQFTAMAIAILAQRGEVDLDRDIRDYFSEIPEYPQGVVTLRHLVHHTSGFRDYNELATLGGYRSDQLATTDATFELLARQRGLNFSPGDEFLYCNSGYFLMGVLVERITGKTLAEFARDEMFEPLGMDHSQFKDDHGAVVANRAYGYQADGDGWRLYLSQRDFVGAGGVFTTVEDMLAWMVNLDDNRLGAPGLMDDMHRVGVLNDGTPLDYAFGLRVGEDRGLALVQHSGSFAAFRAHSLRYPEQGLAVFTAVNGGAANPTQLAQAIADIYLQRLVPGLGPVPAGVRTSSAGERPSDAASTPEVINLAAFAGTYYGPELDATYEILSDGTALSLSLSGVSPNPLALVDEDVFGGDSMTLRFQRSNSGQVTGFVLDGGRVKGLVFDRID
jgi:CubicO group peptidase (beta-lactamase class C family)